MKHLKQLLALALALLVVFTVITGCASENQDDAVSNGTFDKPNTEVPYTLEYTPLGNGTCSVYINTNAAYGELFDVVIPEKSPDGDTVTTVTPCQFTDVIPRVIEKSEFEKKIRIPLMEFYGLDTTLTDDDLRGISEDLEHPQCDEAFRVRQFLSYFVYRDLDQMSDTLKEDSLKAYPILAYADIYTPYMAMEQLEIWRISVILSDELGWTEQDIMNAYETLNALNSEAMSQTYDYKARNLNSAYLIRSVQLPATVTEIDAGAFRGCSMMESITLGSPTVLEPEILYACFRLKTLDIPDTVVDIAQDALPTYDDFVNYIDVPCAIYDVENGYHYVDNWLCGGEGEDGAVLRPDTIGIVQMYYDPDFVIPATIQHISEGIAYSTMQIDPANPYYVWKDGCLINIARKTILYFNENSIIPTDGSVNRIGRGAFGSATSKEYSIPECIEYIGRDAFPDYEQVILPAGLKHMEAYSTDNYNLVFRGTCEEWLAVTIDVNPLEDYYRGFVTCSDGMLIHKAYGLGWEPWPVEAEKET